MSRRARVGGRSPAGSCATGWAISARGPWRRSTIGIQNAPDPTEGSDGDQFRQVSISGVPNEVQHRVDDPAPGEHFAVVGFAHGARVFGGTDGPPDSSTGVLVLASTAARNQLQSQCIATEGDQLIDRIDQPQVDLHPVIRDRAQRRAEVAVDRIDRSALDPLPLACSGRVAVSASAARQERAPGEGRGVGRTDHGHRLTLELVDGVLGLGHRWTTGPSGAPGSLTVIPKLALVGHRRTPLSAENLLCPMGFPASFTPPNQSARMLRMT